MIIIKSIIIRERNKDDKESEPTTIPGFSGQTFLGTGLLLARARALEAAQS